MPDRLRILIVDDDRDFAEGLADLLAVYGHDVSVEFSWVDGLTRVKASRFDLAFLDIRMADGSGLDLLKIVTEGNHAEHAVIVTGDRAASYVSRARENGAVAILQKPVQPERIESVLRDVQRQVREADI